MIQKKTRVVKNSNYKGNYRCCVFYAPDIVKKAKPGQFLNVRVCEGLKPFLRRPFSIHNISGKYLEVLYEVVGEGTRVFSEVKKGTFLDLIGPIGNGFDYADVGDRKASKVILIAGGIGVAPLLFLSRKIKAKDKTILIGARTKDLVLCEKEFKNCGCDVRIATDDGSAGFKGRVTDLLKDFLKNKSFLLGHKRIYACGPKPMLKSVCDISVKNKIPAQVSMEEHMSCGIGACLGCVVKTKNGMERVCKEGPVFNAGYLIW